MDHVGVAESSQKSNGRNQKRNNGNSTGNFNDRRSNSSNIKCFSCGEVGHKSFFCKNKELETEKTDNNKSNGGFRNFNKDSSLSQNFQRNSKQNFWNFSNDKKVFSKPHKGSQQSNEKKSFSNWRERKAQNFVAVSNNEENIPSNSAMDPIDMSMGSFVSVANYLDVPIKNQNMIVSRDKVDVFKQAMWDSGANQHLSGDLDSFENIREIKNPGIIRNFEDRYESVLTHIGDIKLVTLNQNNEPSLITLTEVRYNPKYRCTIISESKFTSKGCYFEGDDNTTNVFTKVNLFWWLKIKIELSGYIM